MSKKTPEIPQDKLDLYDQLVATNAEIERKGVTSPYTSVNGHMFSYLSKSGSMGLRLPKEEREVFLQKYDTILYEQYGRIMKELETVPGDLLQNTDELKGYLDISYAYTKSLKPRPTKKKS